MIDRNSRRASSMLTWIDALWMSVAGRSACRDTRSRLTATALVAAAVAIAPLAAADPGTREGAAGKTDAVDGSPAGVRAARPSPSAHRAPAVREEQHGPPAHATGSIPISGTIDDVAIAWVEPGGSEQASRAEYGPGVCTGGADAGRRCFVADDCGKACVGGSNRGTDCTDDAAVCSGGGACVSGACRASTEGAGGCATLSWQSNAPAGGSGTVVLQLSDFNAAATQGAFDCTRYGFTSGCGGGSCTASNDCDGDGLEEVEVEVWSTSETGPEKVRLERTSAGGSDYEANVVFSTALDAPGDGIVFLQYNGVAFPTATARYFDRDAGPGDSNSDGTPDSPPSNGYDRCPGLCGVDDDRDALGPDGRPGLAFRDDDNNGACGLGSMEPGRTCMLHADCPGGACIFVDEADEACGRTCVAGTTSGLCSVLSGNAGSVCTAPGTTSTCTAGGTCVAINCVTDADCGAGGSCPGICSNGSNAGQPCSHPLDCRSGAVGGACVRAAAWGDDLCGSIDEPDEQCAVLGAGIALGIDDNCGCASNPVSAALDALFDTADLLVQSFVFTDLSDQDGFADDGEHVGVALTLRNVGPYDVEDVRVRLSSQSPGIACFTDPVASYGRINARQSASNGSDALTFSVGNVGRTSLTQVKDATITVTATGTLILSNGTRVPARGTARPLSFSFDLDLDASGSPPVAKTTKVFGFEASSVCIGGTNPGTACTANANCLGGGICSEGYPSGTAFDSAWFHTFVADFSHDAMRCQYNNPANPLAHSTPGECFLRQDPGTQVSDDWHLHSTVIGGRQSDGGRDSGAPGRCANGKTPGSSCSAQADCVGGCTGARAGQGCRTASDCQGTCSNDPTVSCTGNSRCRFCNNDHSITCPNPFCSPGECMAGTCNGVGTCTNPAPGSCLGLGSASMHLGVHFGGDVNADSVTLNNIFYTYYKGEDAGGGFRIPIQIGLGRPGLDDVPILTWWQQMSLVDERTIGNLEEPFALDAGVVEVLVDRNGDATVEVGPPENPNNDGFWQKVKPYYGAPRQQRYPAGNCSYDPDDDGNYEEDLDGNLTLNGRPRGPSSTCFPEFVWACVGDTQDPPYSPGLGQSEPNAICLPEVDANDAPIVRQGTGPGRWVEARVDLSRYRGRKIWFRFLTSHIQFFGGCTWSGPTGGCSVFQGPFGGNRDDGWYIDDIRISGTSNPFGLKPDTDPPAGSTCPGVACGTPDPLTARFTGSTDVTRDDGIDNDGNGAIDESDEGAYTTVISGAPLSAVDLNGQDFLFSTGTCLEGVLEYRFWADQDLNGTLDDGELIRDFAEDARTTASPFCDERLVMDIRCSSAPSACAASATLDVTVEGTLDPFASVVLPDADTMTWEAQAQAAAYDVAYRRIAAPHFDGDFSGFADPGGGPCATGCGIAAASYAVGCKGTPPPLGLDMWIVRARSGSCIATWNEGGAQVGSRDTGPTGVPPSICP